MKQIVIISGKGGTGKTVITGALAALVDNKIIVDCDVDAPDLHLLLNPDVKERHIFKSGYFAVIDKDRCLKCKKCQNLCRFEAINNDLIVDLIACEGCKFCRYLCPADAIILQEKMSGEWFVSETRYGRFLHAKLGIVEANSGKLIALLREKAVAVAENEHSDWIIIDGSPGIGCPVIAGISGANCAVVVTEPTLSGLHDAKRVIQVARHFKIPVKIIINKYDLNAEMTKNIEQYCIDNKILLVGTIPFDQTIANSIVHKKTIMESSNMMLRDLIKQIWNNIIENI